LKIKKALPRFSEGLFVFSNKMPSKPITQQQLVKGLYLSLPGFYGFLFDYNFRFRPACYKIDVVFIPILLGIGSLQT
jgi:hypothetical protein